MKKTAIYVKIVVLHQKNAQNQTLKNFAQILADTNGGEKIQKITDYI